MTLIQPVLARATEDERWEEGKSEFVGRDPTSRWVVHFEVTLADENARAELKKSWRKRFRSRYTHILESDYNKDGEIGELFGFTVCSPAFRKNPNENYLPWQVQRALVQDAFDREAAIKYLSSRLESIGEIEVEEAGDVFKLFLDTDEWDYPESPGP